MEEATDITNPFVKAMKDQRLDYNYVTSLRREVINIVEPFRVSTLDTRNKLIKLEDRILKFEAKTSEFELIQK